MDEVMQEFCKQQVRNVDKCVIDFIKREGYDISDNPTKEELEKLKQELFKEDKFLDYIYDIETDFEKGTATQYIIPFFNSISNPLTIEDKEEILERFKKQGKKG